MEQEKSYSFIVPRLWGNLSAEDAGKELERIREQYGELKPELVVKEAANPNSVLHHCFQWDDSVAAAAYRNEQARNLIKNIRVEIKTTNISCKVRAFVNVREEKEKPRNYVPIQSAILNEVAYNDLLQQAKEDMQSFITTYSQIEELNNVKAEMLKILNS